MKNKLISLLISLSAFLMISPSVFGQPVVFENSIPVLSAETLDGDMINLQAKEIQLLGSKGDSSYVLFADNKYLIIDSQSFNDAIGFKHLDVLDNVSDYKSIPYYSHSSEVSDMQKNLIQLGYLEGIADGDFGLKTQNALQQFQKDHGLDGTAMYASELDQLLLKSLVRKPVSVVKTSSFDVIKDKTDFDINALSGAGFLLEYNEVIGKGFISNMNAVEVVETDGTDLGRYTLSVLFGYNVAERADGHVDISPAISIECKCAQRPIMNDITLMSGEKKCTFPLGSLETSIDGISIIEKAIILLGEEELSVLNTKENGGELKMHISGKYKSFDFVINDENIPDLAINTVLKK